MPGQTEQLVNEFLELRKQQPSTIDTLYIGRTETKIPKGFVDDLLGWERAAKLLSEAKAMESVLRKRLAEKIFKLAQTEAGGKAGFTIVREPDPVDSDYETRASQQITVKADWNLIEKLVFVDEDEFETVEEFAEYLDGMKGVELEEFDCFETTVSFNMKKWKNLSIEASPIEEYIQATDGLPKISIKTV